MSNSEKIAVLYAAYSEAVDQKNWDEWLRLFADECSYALVTSENADRGLPLGYMLDNNRSRLMDRIKFMTEVWGDTVEPYRTRHVVQPTSVASTGTPGEEVFTVRANFIVSYSEPDSITGILASGYSEDRVELTDDAGRYLDRRLVLDGTPARYIIYPL